MNRDVSGNQKLLAAPVMFLPQLAAVSQLGGFIRGCSSPAQVVVLSSGSRHLQSALCFLLG